MFKYKYPFLIIIYNYNLIKFTIQFFFKYFYLPSQSTIWWLGKQMMNDIYFHLY